MKTTIKPLLALAVLAAACFVSTGCGNRTPDPTSDDVKNLVVQIADGHYRDQVAAYAYQSLTGVPTGVIGLKVDYAWLKKNAAESERVKKVLAVVDETMNGANISVVNIRTDKVEKEVGKIFCNADLKFGDQSSPISFTAQYTDDGDLYVEVFGLDGK